VLRDARIGHVHVREPDLLDRRDRRIGTRPDGSAGDDVLLGGAQKDTLYGDSGNDTLRGGPGADVFHGGEGADDFVGGAGIDTAKYGAGSVGVTVTIDDLANDGLPAEGDNVRSDVEDVIAERWSYDSEGRPYPRSVPGEDVFTGSAAANFLETHDDGSRLYGLGGDDVLSWADEQYGGAGNDRLIYPDRAWGGDGDDTIHHSQVAYGEGGNDIIEIDSSNTLISGGDGNDQLLGYGGTATKLHGDAGADYIELTNSGEIFAGDGDDTVHTRDSQYPKPATVHCGTGLDVAIVDQTDVVDFDCETVYRATT
jgi:Ca2+-binding RTX toxin-like protein